MEYQKGLVPLDLINFVPKKWGYETWIVNNSKYCGKILFIKKNCQTSLHYHKIKEETLYIAKGKIKILYGYDTFEQITLKAGDVFHIPPGLIHRLGPTRKNTRIFEFSTQHFDEDSIRI